MKIFISYRRDDSAGYVGRLYDGLRGRYDASSLFMDVDHIQPGEDFVAKLEQAVAECDVVLVVIGRNWITAADPEGQRRLEDPNDFVRVEVAAALSRDVRVVPVLVDHAVMPAATLFPSDLRSLSRRQAASLRHESWPEDLARLMRGLEHIEKAIAAGVANAGYSTLPKTNPPQAASVPTPPSTPAPARPPAAAKREVSRPAQAPVRKPAPAPEPALVSGVVTDRRRWFAKRVIRVTFVVVAIAIVVHLFFFAVSIGRLTGQSDLMRILMPTILMRSAEIALAYFLFARGERSAAIALAALEWSSVILTYNNQQMRSAFFFVTLAAAIMATIGARSLVNFHREAPPATA
ncbi:MAG: toll/interleukin-1 receptor domain-containing protein [Gemmatimonadota bacterium]|nr:toll/interleukin-1 receptor domain-containing protein [Gemmatimonadota bacterium]